MHVPESWDHERASSIDDSRPAWDLCIGGWTHELEVFAARDDRYMTARSSSALMTVVFVKAVHVGSAVGAVMTAIAEQALKMQNRRARSSRCMFARRRSRESHAANVTPKIGSRDALVARTWFEVG